MDNNELTPHIQDSISFLAITNTEFLGLIRKSLRVTLLPTFITRDLLRVCYNYYDVSKEAPGADIFNVLKGELGHIDIDRYELILRYIERIFKAKEPNIDYVIHRLSSFIKTREFNLAAVEFVKLVESQEFEQAQKLMHEALRIGIAKEDIGCDYFSDYKTMYYFDDDDFIMPTGFDDLGTVKPGYKRGEFISALGGYKGGKSWFGIHTGKVGLLHGLNVLHISHENSLQETAERYDRDIGSLIRKSDEGKKLYFHFVDKDGTVKNERMVRPSIADVEERKKARRTMETYGGRLIIKKYPPQTCTIYDLEEYLDYLEIYRNFVPDLLINDYADIMKPINQRQEMRNNLNDIYLHHKRLADDRNMVVVTMSQSTRKAIRSSRLRMSDLAEDIRKAANVDTLLGICQDDDQAQASLGKMYILASRTGRMDFGCNFVQNLDFGHFCTQTYKIDD